MFPPQTEVKAYRLELTRPRKDGRGEESAWLNILLWEDEGKSLSHCLELDIAGEGTTSKEALENLADLIVEQIEFSEERKTQLYHPAPKEYWDKLNEIRENHVKQSLLDHPPRSAEEILKGLAPIHA